MNELKRANKITAYWEGDGVAVAVYYKTHDKIATVKSNDEKVQAMFTMPCGTEEAPVNASQKLEAFKTFMAANAAVFGITYDPVDRRADEFKFPGKYNAENLVEYAGKMLEMSVEKVLTSVQTNVVDKMVKAGNLPEGAELSYGTGDAVVNITESYANGNIKYATVKYPVTIAVGEAKVDTTVDVDLVSGQLKKPRNIGDTVLTMTGVKEMLVGAGVLPKIEKKAKTEDAAESAEAEAEAELNPSDVADAAKE